jgi:hypothetical protein
MPFCRRPMVIARRSTRPSATTKMNWRSPKGTSASSAIRTASTRVDSVSPTFMNMPGFSRRSAFGSTATTSTARVTGSTRVSMAVTVPVKVSVG